MEQFNNYIQTLSNSKLTKKLKELEKSAEEVGKQLPKLDKEQREMYLKEYETTLEHIDDIKNLLNERKEKELSKEQSTIEKLFPTVTKIINDNADPTKKKDTPEKDNTEDIQEEATEEVKEETKEEIKEEASEIKEEVKQEIKETKEIKIEETPKEENKAKEATNIDKSKKDADDMFLEFIDVSNTKSTSTTVPDVIIADKKDDHKPIITEPIRPQTVLEEIKADGSIEKVTLGNSGFDLTIDDILGMDEFDGDAQTTILATTKEDIIQRPIKIVTEEYINEISTDDAKRDIELLTRARTIVKEKIKDTSIDKELEDILMNKLDIIDKNINQLKVKIA